MAACPSHRTGSCCIGNRNSSESYLKEREQIMGMGKKSIFAALWVLGIPLPLLVIVYFLTSGGCN
ncbi:hypothetical protein VN12_15125 [Pirellula sp. SH-Sr6A]|nr:hypothetical protein VN12_15125 [Pirellula sp. SH-Sr6A]